MTSIAEKITKPIADWYQTSSVHGFMQWWNSELKTFIPDRYRNQLFQQSELIYINKTNDEDVSLWSLKEQTIDSLTVDENELTENQWWHQVQHHQAKAELNSELVCLIPESQALFRNIALPSAAINELDSVLAFELDKYVPYAAEDVVFAYRKEKVLEGAEKTPVLLVAVKRKIIDGLVNDMSSKGLHLASIDVNVSKNEEPKPLGVNLLEESQRKKKDWSKFKLNSALLIVAALMLSFVMFTSIENKEEKIENLQAKVDKLKKQARNARTLEMQLNESIVAANFLGNKKENTPKLMGMVGELTSNVPKNTYLTRIMVNGDRIEVVGQSDNANALVPILNRSEQWCDPQIVGQVVPDARTSKEKFTIKADLQCNKEMELTNES